MPGACRRLRCGAVAATALFALTLAACGWAEEELPGPRFLSAKQIQKQAPDKDTPERVALEWWRLVQFGNTAAAITKWDPGLELDPDALNKQMAAAAAAFVGVPRVESVDAEDSLATVYLILDPPDPDAAERTVSVNLMRIDGDWKLADNLLIEQAVERAERAQRARSG